MIPVPTAPWVHAPFDLLAWASGALLGRALYRWRLRSAALDLARATGPGYFVCLAVGAVAGVELYKLVRGIRGSTGASSPLRARLGGGALRTRRRASFQARRTGRPDLVLSAMLAGAENARSGSPPSARR